FSPDGTRLMGGVLVGDAGDYALLSSLAKSGKPLTVPPGELIVGKRADAVAGADDLDDDCQVCSCNNVTKGQLCAAIAENNLTELGEVRPAPGPAPVAA